MKTLTYSILAGVTMLILVFSCSKETKNSKELILSGMMTSHSDCINSKSNAVFITADSLSCVEYSFDGLTNKLVLKHLNAGFNCYPDSMYCNVTMRNDTIFIQEFESQQLCSCECLYDLDIEIHGVVAKMYQIEFIEPYRGNQEQIRFLVDFSTQLEGTFCVTRNQYPWGE
jgi:hypothetical protein